MRLEMTARGDSEVAKAAFRIKPPTTSQKLMWGGSAALAGSAPAASHRMRSQKDRKGGAAAGAAAGLAGTKLGLDTSGYALREGIKHHGRRVDAGEIPHPLSRKQRRNIESAHRAKHGITSGTMQGAPMKAWRDYPTALPAGRLSRVMGWKNTKPVALGILAAGTAAGAAAGGRRQVRKVDTTMSEAEAHRIAQRYDTRGPLPKGLSRDQRMKAYEGRYIAAGGRKAEKWKRRADASEVGRNIGLVGATTSAAALLASRGKRVGPVMARNKVLRHATPHRLETAALSSALGGGWSELYGEHARAKRASYQNSPAGVAGSALSRMQAYTPEKKR